MRGSIALPRRPTATRAGRAASRWSGRGAGDARARGRSRASPGARRRPGRRGAGWSARRDVPDNLDEVAARYVAAAPRYGIEFV